MADIISVKNLKKDFKTKYKEEGLLGSFKSIIRPKTRIIKAVENISFEVKEGEIIGFIGPNGAGKSTTIKILTGILHPTAGQVKVLGYVPWEDRKKLSYNIASVFGQKPQLWYHLPAIDTFNLLAEIYDLDKKEYKQRLDYLVKSFELDEFLHQPVRKLSLGQRMRCEIAASLLHKPKIILLDEPTIGLDIVVKQKLRELIKEINKKEKTTIFLTSHDTQDIEHLCDRIIIINHGKIVFDDSLKVLKTQFLKNKIVSVKFDVETKKVDIKGVKVLKSNQFGAKLEVDTTKKHIADVIDYLMKHYSVEDINITDPPIEEVISKIYQTK